MGGSINIQIDKIGALVLSIFMFTMDDWPFSASKQLVQKQQSPRTENIVYYGRCNESHTY